MAPSSSHEYRTDPRTGKKVRWSESKQAWVDEKGKVVNTSRTLERNPDASRSSTSKQPENDTPQPRDFPQRVAAGPSGYSTGSRARRVSSSSQNPDLSRAMARTSLGQPSSYATTSQQIVQPGGSSPSQLDTDWQFQRMGSMPDPYSNSNTKEINLKRVRENNPAAYARPASGYGHNRDPERDYRIGRVIEALVVPPAPSSASRVTRITPVPNFNGLTRLRRFVVMSHPPGRRCFRALAIKTYNGQGVAASGIIKFTHSIIYTNRLDQSPEEGPSMAQNGQLDSMQPRAIRVVPYDKAQALDPKARLDYCDIYEMDYDFPNIKVFGYVHDGSRAALESQYQNVWHRLHGSASGSAGFTPLSPVGMTGANVSEAETPRAGPSSVVTAVRGPQYPQVLMSSWFRPNSGRITRAQLQSVLDPLKSYAESNGLTMPDEELSETQLSFLANNATPRSLYAQRVWEWWRNALQARMRSEQSVVEEEDDEEEDDDDEESDDGDSDDDDSDE